MTGPTKNNETESVNSHAESDSDELKHRLALALEAGAVGAWDWNLDTDTCSRSLRHDQIFGYETAVSDWNFEIFLRHVLVDDRPEVERTFKRPRELKGFRFECRIVTTRGETRWVEITGSPFIEKSGAIKHVIGTIVDTTAQKLKAESELIKAVLAERDSFVAMLTHDMKTPLVGSNRVLELLSSGTLGEISKEHKQLLVGLQLSNHGLLNLIRDVADSYRLDKDIDTLMLEHVNLRDVLESSVRNVSHLAQLQAVRVATKFEDDANFVFADSSQLRRLIQNLLDNAMKFAGANGVVQVRLRNDEKSAVMEFENNGPAIPSHELGKLFSKFGQGSVGRTHALGTGLGLYVCKQITEAHGGTIACTSQNGLGTTFSVNLPLVKSTVH